MKSLFETRFEDELQKINNRLNKKNTTKKLDKIHQRIGRYKQKYPSVSKYYDIDVICDGKNKALEVKWIKIAEKHEKATDELMVYLTRNHCTTAPGTPGLLACKYSKISVKAAWSQ